jgi:hypothetical protein
MLHLLHQYHLPHHRIYLLQVEKNLAFLQRPSKVGDLFGPRTGGTHLGDEVPLDGIDTGVSSVMFHAHLPEHAQRLPSLSPT